MIVRALAGGLSALALLVMVGCGGGQPSAPSPTNSATAPAGLGLPPRPAALSTAGVNPCDLLTEAQRSAYGVGAGQYDDKKSGINQGPGCTWSSVNLHPDYGYSAGFVLNRGVDAVRSSEPVRTVGGFGAVTAIAPGIDPAHYCGLFVDIAPGQALGMSYDDNGNDMPGMTRQVACDKAQQAAEVMLANLRAITHQ